MSAIGRGFQPVGAAGSEYLFTMHGGAVEEFRLYRSDRAAVKAAYNRAATANTAVAVFRMDALEPLRIIPEPRRGSRGGLA